MASNPKEYEDIPGTWVFDAERARLVKVHQARRAELVRRGRAQGPPCAHTHRTTGGSGNHHRCRSGAHALAGNGVEQFALPIAGHTGNAAAPDQLDGLVGPRRVAHEVAEMVGDKSRLCLDAGQHCLEGREVRMDVGDERVASHAAPANAFFITRAVFEQANEYSSVAWMSAGASARSMVVNPKLGKYRSAVVVSR